MLGYNADDPGHQDGPAGGGRQHDAHAGDACHLAGAGHGGGVHARHGEGKGKQQRNGRALRARPHEEEVEDGAADAHDHHGLAGLPEGEDEGNEEPGHKGGPPHDGDGVGRQRPGDDAAALKVSDHPACDALLGGVLAEQQARQQPEADRVQKAPINFLFAALAACLLPAHGGGEVDQPEHHAQRSQREHGQRGAHPARRRNEEGAEQRAAGVAAVHQVHAPGAVRGVGADEDGAGVHGAALGHAHQEEGQREHQLGSRQAHQAVAHGITRGQQQDTGLHAQHPRQDAGEEACQQVADAHEGEQGARHAVGKAVALLQKAHHHAAGDGADAAEKEGDEARIPQAGAGLLLLHKTPLFYPCLYP